MRNALIETFGLSPDRLVAQGLEAPIPGGGRRAGAPAPGAGSARIELVRIAAKNGAQTPDGPGEWTGRITTGMMAIGGETTGVILSAGPERFELQAADQMLRRRLQELSGKTVTVRGTLETRPGVEIRSRRIIIVREIIEQPESSGR